MKKLEKMSLSELKKVMQTIADTFFASKKYQKQKPRLSDCAITEEESEREVFISKVETSYQKLDPLEQLFINNEFFYEAYPFWWMETFSKNTYYRCKKKAIVSFLRNFYDYQ